MINNPANNQDEKKCFCWKMDIASAAQVMYKAMECGSEYCKRYQNKDIWNVRGSAKDDIYGDKE